MQVGVKRRRRTGVRLALGVGVPAVLLLALSQALLPRLAEQRVRDRIEPYGSLEQVSVSAFPAVELLWGKAERVSARASRLTFTQAQALRLTWEGRGVRDADLSVGALSVSVPGLPTGMVLHDVVMHKRGSRLFDEGTLSQADLEAASPEGFRIEPLTSTPGTVRVRASGSLFGVNATVEAVAAPSEGKLVAQPLGIPFGQFIRMTLFSDEHVYLDGISIAPLQSARTAMWRFALSAHLR